MIVTFDEAVAISAEFAEEHGVVVEMEDRGHEWWIVMKKFIPNDPHGRFAGIATGKARKLPDGSERHICDFIIKKTLCWFKHAVDVAVDEHIESLKQ